MPSQYLESLSTPAFSPELRSHLARISPAASAASVSNLRLQALAGGTAELMIYGPIGSSWFGEKTVEADAVVQALAGSTATTLNVRVNSFGGNVADGIAIYNELRRQSARGAKVIAHVEGVAMSIASLIVMGADEVVMNESAVMMLHAPWGDLSIQGNARVVREVSEEFAVVLDVLGTAMSAAYARKTGRPASDFDSMWASGNDHYFTAAEAQGFGLCDRIGVDAPVHAFAALGADSTAALLADIATRAPQYVARVRAALNIQQPAAAASHSGDMTMPAPNSNESSHQQIIAAERNRVADIRAMAAPHVESGERAPRYRAAMDQAIAEGATPEAFGQRMLALMAEGREPLGSYGVSTDEGYGRTLAGGRGGSLVRAASDVLAARGGVPVENMHAGAGDLRGMSISDIARACLPRDAFERGMSGPAAIRAAMTTSDFPAILGDTIGKALRRGYEMEPGTHSIWVRRGTVPDFKEQTRAILGAMPDLLPVLEGGEYTHGAIGEDKSVPFRVEKFGRLIEVTWEMLVNDDLSALTRFPQGLGQAARRKEADLVYGLFDNGGQVMQDGLALFHATHGNLATASATLDEEALAKGRLLMRKQRTVGGGALNITPKYLLVPAEFEGQAEKILAASSIHVSAGLENATPEWIRRLTLVVESRLPDGAAYLLADHNQVDTVELATLEDDGPAIGKSVGPYVTEEDGFDRDTKKFKVRLVAGARFLDWRGVVKLPISA